MRWLTVHLQIRQVCNADGQPLDGYQLTSANQEHGILSRTGPEPDHAISTRFPIGTQLRILPNHACATGAQFPEYHTVVATAGSEPEAASIWQRFYGW